MILVLLSLAGSVVYWSRSHAAGPAYSRQSLLNERSGFAAAVVGGTNDWTVTNTNDSGPGSVREAVAASRRGIRFDLPADRENTIALRSPLEDGNSEVIMSKGRDATLTFSYF